MALHCVRDSDSSPKKCIRKINAKVELSTWTFEDAMAFADGVAMAA